MMMLSIKPDVHNVSQCHQRRTEPRPQATCTKNLVKFGCVVFELCVRTQTDRQTYVLITITLQPQWGEVNNILSSALANAVLEAGYCYRCHT